MSDGHLFLYIDHAVLFIAFTVFCALLLHFARPGLRRRYSRGGTARVLSGTDSRQGAAQATSSSR